MAVSDNYQPEYALRRPGLPYNRWLANVLLAMGVPASDFEYPGETGYGLQLCDNDQAWPSHLLADMSDMLPRLAG
jgi:hypothetical protein